MKKIILWISAVMFLLVFAFSLVLNGFLFWGKPNKIYLYEPTKNDYYAVQKSDLAGFLLEAKDKFLADGMISVKGFFTRQYGQAVSELWPCMIEIAIKAEARGNKNGELNGNKTGYSRGFSDGRMAGIREVKDKSYEDGRSRGYKSGFDSGFESGIRSIFNHSIGSGTSSEDVLTLLGTPDSIEQYDDKTYRTRENLCPMWKYGEVIIYFNYFNKVSYFTGDLKSLIEQRRQAALRK